MTIDISLYCIISHPNIEPEEISEKLCLRPYLAHRSGDEVVTPAGTKPGGTYSCSKWCYKLGSLQHDSMRTELTVLIKYLVAQKEYFDVLCETGGRISVFFRISDPEYLSFTVSKEILELMSSIDIEFGYEIFTDQN